MHPFLSQMMQFSAAEEFFKFLRVDFDPAIMNISRLHILKRFHQYLRATPVSPDLCEDEARACCRQLLAQAYEDFVRSNAVTEKVFKVFQHKAGTQTISVENLLASLHGSSI
jgi:nitrogenase-stabilizing/protective protein